MEAKVETCLIAKYLWEMLDATLEVSQFLVTSFVRFNEI